MNQITILDILILVVFLYFVLRGYNNGFIKQTSTVVGLILALLIAIKFYQPFQKYLLPYLDFSDQIMQFISFSLLFVFVNIIIQLLGRALKNIMNALFLGPVDQVAGAALGLLKAGILTYFLVLFLAQIPYQGITELLNRSVLAGSLLEMTPLVKQRLSQIFGP
ncbi:CvpA family protein [Halothermothrix orenii]|uniref:Colicin V production protein n=1 Tax=Halothermothrix orenii (strain H 168 / OCM 544 / DSM 9562) TaxID=373903 RepID=B8D296_HALOH|nr:CvpA family protein [Halothermothrix orenii]ACL69323.1 Colicin V production protein [Halothermothrix orenii H 168]